MEVGGFSQHGQLNLNEVAEYARGADLLALQESEALSPVTGLRDVPGYLAASTQAHDVRPINMP